MDSQDSTHTPSVQDGELRESALVRLAARMRHVSRAFGWPMWILMLIGPSHLREFPQEFLIVLFFFGLAPVLCGIWLRIWSRGFKRAEGFVLDGPYRYVRNPVELGALLGYVGAGVFLGLRGWYIALIIAIATAYLSVVGLANDQELLKRHGTTYLRYLRRVYRWIPRSLPATNRSYRNHSIREGLRLELESLIWLAGYVAIFAIKKRFG